MPRRDRTPERDLSDAHRSAATCTRQQASTQCPLRFLSQVRARAVHHAVTYYVLRNRRLAHLVASLAPRSHPHAPLARPRPTRRSTRRHTLRRIPAARRFGPLQPPRRRDTSPQQDELTELLV